MFNYDNIPITAGRHYSYIDQATFESYYSEGDRYELDDLEIGKKYKFYRAAKTDDGQLVFMTIVGELISWNDFEDQMFFMHSPMKGKTMYIDGYKDHWYFIPVPE